MTNLTKSGSLGRKGIALGMTNWCDGVSSRARARDLLFGLVVAQKTDQARRVPASAAARLNTRIKLIEQCSDRQRRAVGARFRETDRQILAHPVDGETKLELVRDHCLATIFHLPGLRGTFADDVEHA